MIINVLLDFTVEKEHQQIHDLTINVQEGISVLKELRSILSFQTKQNLMRHLLFVLMELDLMNKMVKVN